MNGRPADQSGERRRRVRAGTHRSPLWGGLLTAPRPATWSARQPHPQPETHPQPGCTSLDPRPSTLDPPPPARRGFTLVELLIVVVIITILASVSLATLQQARNTARTARTKALIAKLNEIVINQYASYRTRRVPMSQPDIQQVALDNGWWDPLTEPDGPARDATARVRLLALRQLMRLEMPERLSDITTGTTIPATDAGYLSDDPYSPVPIPGSSVTIARPTLSRAYLRRLGSTPNVDNMPAECLYMIAALSDPDARAQFVESEIDDTDADGLPEFIDGWGNPVYFLRWAPGFDDSDIQPNYPVNSNDAQADHDPFDPLNVDTVTPAGDTSGWRLIPLIYSAGPNGDYGIGYDTPTDEDPYVWRSDTYAIDLDSVRSGTQPAGTPDGTGNHFDNIHNHRIEAD